MEEMRTHGWHNGFQREHETGHMTDLAQLYRNAMPRKERIQRLSQLVSQLQQEAESLAHGIVVIWHPGIDIKDVRAASTARVIELAPRTAKEAIEQWQEIRGAWSRTTT